jgi:hypothetical protein
VISGFIAAALWFGATIVTVPYKRRIVRGEPQMALVETDDETGKETDVFDTAKRQTKWNRWAALFTAISVFCQAVSLML